MKRRKLRGGRLDAPVDFFGSVLCIHNYKATVSCPRFLQGQPRDLLVTPSTGPTLVPHLDPRQPAKEGLGIRREFGFRWVEAKGPLHFVHTAQERLRGRAQHDGAPTTISKKI